MNRTTRSLRLGMLLMAATILFVEAYAAAQARKPTSRRRRQPRVELKVGQDAPNFELVPLVFKTNDRGVKVGVIGTKKIKLSDYKGKAPVCVFSSSYT